MRFLSLLIIASGLFAGTFEMFGDEKFALSQTQERTILLHFYRLGCPVCDEQVKALKELAAIGGALSPVSLMVEFDKEQEIRSLYGVTAPSTMLLFKGKRLIGRSVGKMRIQEIRDFVRESRMNARGLPPRRPKRSILPKR